MTQTRSCCLFSVGLPQHWLRLMSKTSSDAFLSSQSRIKVVVAAKLRPTLNVASQPSNKLLCPMFIHSTREILARRRSRNEFQLVHNRPYNEPKGPRRWILPESLSRITNCSRGNWSNHRSGDEAWWRSFLESLGLVCGFPTSSCIHLSMWCI